MIRDEAAAIEAGPGTFRFLKPVADGELAAENLLSA
jgi:hypothetical protein